MENEFLPVASGRRKFISNLSKLTGSAILLSQPVLSIAGNIFQTNVSWSVGQIMDLFIKEVPGSPFEKTVDTLKSGNRDTVVTGIVTSMFPTLGVIQKAIALGANFLIVHEPSFYNHLDETAWLEKDDVFRYKIDLLNKHNIAIWRNHDYIHRHNPDGVLDGVVTQLGWKKFMNKDDKNIALMPAIPLRSLIQKIKEKLGIATVRYTGDLSQSCNKILLMPGAAGGTAQIQAIGTKKPDVLLCGEIHEWETAEYVRDARTKGQNISLVVLGHVQSEEAGSEFMAKWLKGKLPDMKVIHVPAKNPLAFL